MIDPGLIAAANKALGAKPRHFVTLPILLAFVMQESHGMPYFDDTKPGSLYLLNVYDAVRPTVRNRSGEILHRATTGLTEQEIRQWLTIAEDVGGWRPPKNMIGQKAKFRFELSYWNKFGALPKEQRFRMSCSWGLVQFMGPNIVGKLKGDEADLAIRRFAADVELQLLEGAGMIDELLVRNAGDVRYAYMEYNCGRIDTKDINVLQRVKNVADQAETLARQLGGK